MKPFFTYYGGKYRAAPRYPHPKYQRLIEPFAGSAGYALRYPTLEVHLYDVDDKICGLWDYLINVSTAEIRRLPIDVTNVTDLSVCPEAKWLIGFWLNKGSAQPCKRPSAWMRGKTHESSFWGSAIRERIASQVDLIRHWKISRRSYNEIPNISATWFVDPPYQNPVGRHYKHNYIDYVDLAGFCESRDGEVIVCEQEGASWLPFRPFMNMKVNESKNGKGISKEVIWYSI